MKDVLKQWSLPDPFPVAKYRFEIEVTRPVRWPDFEGSILRGIFGSALRQVACITGRVSCEGCRARERCVYSMVFESHVPRMEDRTSIGLTPLYVIVPPTSGPRELGAGDRYAFDLVLIGEARRHLGLLVSAWKRALSLPIGAASGSATLIEVSVVDALGQTHPLMDRLGLDTGRPIPEHRTELPLEMLGEWRSSSTLHWKSPVRIKREGVVLDEDSLEASDVIIAVARRVLEVCRVHLGTDSKIDLDSIRQLTKDIRSDEKALKWVEFHRWSNRQERRMPMAGVSGIMHLNGDLSALWPLLRLGEWLNVGGKISFGFGAYQLNSPESVELNG